MVPDVPITDVHGRVTPFFLTLAKGRADNVELQIAADFAGRQVEEELPLYVLQQMTGPNPVLNNDLLGLTFESDGKLVQMTIGVGSGNERCSVTCADLAVALSEF